MNFLSKAMQDFGVEKKEKAIDPVQLFYEELIQKPNYNFLRDNQTEFLRKWQSKREDRDVVGVMETGERVIIVTGCNKCFKIKGFKNFIKEIHALLRAINL